MGWGRDLGAAFPAIASIASKIDVATTSCLTVKNILVVWDAELGRKLNGGGFLWREFRVTNAPPKLGLFTWTVAHWCNLFF